MIARVMFNKDEKFRDNVEGFHKFKDDRKRAYEERMKRIFESYKR